MAIRVDWCRAQRKGLRWSNKITNIGIVLKTVGVEEVTLVGV